MTSEQDAEEDISREVERVLAGTGTELSWTRYWLEISIAVLAATVVTFVVSAFLRTHRTVVAVRDVSKGSVLEADDVVEVRMPRLDASMTRTRDVAGLVAAEDIYGGTALRHKDLSRQQAVSVGPLQIGDVLTATNTAFKLTTYVPRAVTDPSELGRAAKIVIPEATIIAQHMLESDRIVGRAARDLAPFVLLYRADVTPWPVSAGHVVALRPIPAGQPVRTLDLLSVPPALTDAVVVSYRVVAGPLHPARGAAVMLVRAGKEGGRVQIPATLLWLDTSGDATTAVVAVQSADALRMAQPGTDLIHLLQPIGGK